MEASGEALSRPYEALASLLNCSQEEIAILTSATAAWQQVVYGLAWRWIRNDRVLVCEAEYGSNFIAFLQLSKRTGALIEVMPDTKEGDIDLVSLEGMINDPEKSKPVLISLTHIPTSSGRVYNAEAVGRIAQKYKITFILDACQSVGQIPVDVKAIQCDFLSGTGRKYLRSVRGSGFLYARSTALRQLEPGFLDNVGATWTGPLTYQMASDAKRFESYEMSFASKVGLGIAVQRCIDRGMETLSERLCRLAAEARQRLSVLHGVFVHDHGTKLCGIVSFTKEGMTAEEVKQKLAVRGVHVSASKLPSTRIDFEKRGLVEVVRASFHYYNTDGELESFIRAVDELERGGCEQTKEKVWEGAAPT